MVLGVLQHFLQDSAEAFATSVCDELGVPWGEIENSHLDQFAVITRAKLGPLLGTTKASFIAGVIEKLKERGV